MYPMGRRPNASVRRFSPLAEMSSSVSPSPSPFVSSGVSPGGVSAAGSPPSGGGITSSGASSETAGISDVSAASAFRSPKSSAARLSLLSAASIAVAASVRTSGSVSADQTIALSFVIPSRSSRSTTRHSASLASAHARRTSLSASTRVVLSPGSSLVAGFTAHSIATFSISAGCSSFLAIFSFPFPPFPAASRSNRRLSAVIGVLGGSMTRRSRVRFFGDLAKTVASRIALDATRQRTWGGGGGGGTYASPSASFFAASSASRASSSASVSSVLGGGAMAHRRVSHDPAFGASAGFSPHAHALIAEVKAALPLASCAMHLSATSESARASLGVNGVGSMSAKSAWVKYGESVTSRRIAPGTETRCASALAHGRATFSHFARTSACASAAFCSSTVSVRSFSLSSSAGGVTGLPSSSSSGSGVGGSGAGTARRCLNSSSTTLKYTILLAVSPYASSATMFRPRMSSHASHTSLRWSTSSSPSTGNVAIARRLAMPL
mmetsp:Transcript_5011/g.22596  ORF Transcript_5011/g.22596 Transcript_5011/m.22596 type:complete len:496 (-) Transcript_5011:207-1694(-)